MPVQPGYQTSTPEGDEAVTKNARTVVSVYRIICWRLQESSSIAGVGEHAQLMNPTIFLCFLGVPALRDSTLT
jgi:hypothetical protein